MKIKTEHLTVQEGGTITGEEGSMLDFKYAWSLQVPRFATASLPNPIWVQGAIAYDTTLDKLVFSNGTAWETLTSA